ncbi:MAG: tripartite tricarboxylate transporter substrate binding protein BugD [Burkholderiales bacterium]
MKLLKNLLVLAISLGLSANALAQNYPDRPITLIVPFAAGGPTDVVARSLALSMGSDLKQPIVVDNAGGAGGTIGSKKAADAQADGYTLLLMHIGMATAPSLYKKLLFDPLKSYEYIGLTVDVPMTLLGKAALPPNNLNELLPYIKQNASKMNVAHAGIGSASHLCGLLFMSTIQQDIQTIAYRGTGPAMTGLLAGEVDLLCDQTTNTTAQIQSGKVKTYGISSARRSTTLPNVPTLDEAGLKGFQLGVWHGLYAPKGTPKPIIDRLLRALQAGLKDPAFVKRMEELGARVVSEKEATPDALRNKLQSEINLWSPIIQKAGVYAD